MYMCRLKCTIITAHIKVTYYGHFQDNSRFQMPIHDAVKNGDKDSVISILEKDPSSIERPQVGHSKAN